MGFDDSYMRFINRLPAIASPIQRQTLNARLKWTAIILLLFLALSQITAFGVDRQRIQSLGVFEVLLGAQFGSIMSLGIGPVVTASIILQLLVGSKIIPWNLQEQSGKIMFQGTQKLLGILLSFAEAFVFVSFGAVPAAGPELIGIVVVQLALGGILVIYMDEVISKWGFGSGISLFIVAGVASQIVASALNPFGVNCPGGSRLCFPGQNNPPVGGIPQSIFFLGSGNLLQAGLALLPVIATLLVFIIAIYANGIKVEIPLAFGSIRGFGRRWPLKFFYTSNIPVILIAALLANMQLFGRLLQQRGITILGTFDQSGFAVDGLLYYITAPSIGLGAGLGVSIALIIIGGLALLGVLAASLAKQPPWKFASGGAVLGLLLWYAIGLQPGLSGIAFIPPQEILRLVTYSAVLIGGAVLFSVFWVATAGMDAKAVAGQIESIGLQIPGYRRDPRIIEMVLSRYIPVLTVIGGAAVGLLAAYADFTGALGTGTGILLSSLIISQLYEQLEAQQLEDMHPAMRRFFAK